MIFQKEIPIQQKINLDLIKKVKILLVILILGDVLPNEWRAVTTLKDIEDFFETFWKKMKPDYYESN